MIVVLAPDPSVAGWCARPIDLDGHGLSVVRPRVIGPDQIPVVTDSAKAERAPGLTALSVIAHGRGEHALGIGRAGLGAAATLDGPDVALYTDLVLHHLDAVARRALEREMALKLKNKYEYQSSTVRRLFAEGEARGKAQGQAEGKVRALLVLLEARGVHLEASLRARIEAASSDELDALVARAATIDDLDELFAG